MWNLGQRRWRQPPCRVVVAAFLGLLVATVQRYEADPARGAGLASCCSRIKPLRTSRRALMSSSQDERHDDPVFRFGVISDVQYADIEDAWNFARTERRRHRGALESLRHAIQDWSGGPKLQFIADLGDMIDQQCETHGTSARALASVLAEWERAPVEVHHLIGNHELYNFNREDLQKRVKGMAPWYRSFSPSSGWRVIILDPYERNCIEKNGKSIEDGIEYLSKFNPNDLRAPRGTVNVCQGLEGIASRFVPMGGAVGAQQLEWLRGQLREASERHEKAIILSHLPVKPGAASDQGLLWNFEQVLETFRNVPPGTVPLLLAGHDHKGGYQFDQQTKTHHITLPSPLLAPEANPLSHATVEVWGDRIEVHGEGLVRSRPLHFA